MELAALEREFDEHYEDICNEEAARQNLHPEAAAARQAAATPKPVSADDDDLPLKLDLGVERIDITVAPPKPER